MKKIFISNFLLLSILSFLSCQKSSSNTSSNNNSSSNQDSGPGIYTWSCKIDGKSYSWSGAYPAAGSSKAQATFTASSAQSILGLDDGNSCSISLIFSNVASAPASYNVNFNSLSQGFTATLSLMSSSTNISLFGIGMNGGDMTVNVDSYSSATYASNPANPGKVKGTFSGTLYDMKSPPTSSKAISITEGKFEAVRLQ
jgi:hypothetical protein